MTKQSTASITTLDGKTITATGTSPAEAAANLLREVEKWLSKQDAA